MKDRDHETIVTVAYLAALADGRTAPAEDQELRAALGRLGVTDVDAVAQRGSAVRAPLADLARQLSDDDARRLAFETALVVCHADGPLNRQEADFLGALRSALGLPPLAEEQSAADCRGRTAARSKFWEALRRGRSDDAASDDHGAVGSCPTSCQRRDPAAAAAPGLSIGQQYGETRREPDQDSPVPKARGRSAGNGRWCGSWESRGQAVRRMVGAWAAWRRACGDLRRDLRTGHVAKQYYAQGRDQHTGSAGAVSALSGRQEIFPWSRTRSNPREAST
jgi:tellurite resistance protein